MKNFSRIFAFFVVIALVSCVSKKKTTSAPIKFIPPPVKVEAPVDTDSLIPFTRELYNKLRDAKLDVRKLTFFIDQTVILSRGLDLSQYDIIDGKLINKSGTKENKIELLALTPGQIEAIEPDGLRVSFEKGNNMKFINNKYSPEFFIFSGSNWDRGTAEISYRGTTYRASCGTCSSVGEAKLVVRQKDINVGDTNTSQIGGNPPTGSKF